MAKVSVTKPPVVKAPRVSVKAPKFSTTKVPSVKTPKPTGVKSAINSMFS